MKTKIPKTARLVGGPGNGKIVPFKACVYHVMKLRKSGRGFKMAEYRWEHLDGDPNKEIGGVFKRYVKHYLTH